MFLDQVVLVSTVPLEGGTSSSIASSNTYKHTVTGTKNKSSTSNPSAINSGTESIGQIYQLELGAGETFGVKVAPFTYKDSSIPTNCLSLIGNNLFSNDCALLAYHATLSALFVYSASKDRPVSRSFGHERLTALSTSPCGRFLLAGTESGTLILWRVGSGDLMGVFEGAHFQALRVIRFSPDGQSVATGASDALIKIWSWSDLCTSSSTGGSTSGTSGTSGTSVTSGTTGTTGTTGGTTSNNNHNHNHNTLNPLFTFSQHSAPVTDLIFSLTTIGIGRGRLLSGSLDGKCNFYDLVDGQLLLSVTMPSPLSAVALNANETTIFAACVDGNIYTCNLNGSVNINININANTNINTNTNTSLKFHKGPISCLQWSLDERVLISCGVEDGQVAFWDPQSHQLLKSIQLSTNKKVSCTNILVIGKSDPLHMDTPSSINYAPFKRVGNQLSSISNTSPLLPISKFSSENSKDASEESDASRQKLNDLFNENEELKLLNSELCSIVCNSEQ